MNYEIINEGPLFNKHQLFVAYMTLGYLCIYVQFNPNEATDSLSRLGTLEFMCMCSKRDQPTLPNTHLDLIFLLNNFVSHLMSFPLRPAHTSIGIIQSNYFAIIHPLQCFFQLIFPNSMVEGIVLNC